MSTDVESVPKQSAGSLVSEILFHLQHLVEQQLHLTRCEIERELGQRSTAAALFGLGVAFLFLDAIALCMTLAHLMHWAMSPPGSDPSRLPLWACFGILTMVLVVIGGILAAVGRAKFRSVELCRNPATEIM